MRTTSIVFALLCSVPWLKSQTISDPCTIEAQINIGICIDSPCIPFYGNVSNGAEPYSYLWFNGTSIDRTYLYYVTSPPVDTCVWLQVTDAKGCVAFASVRYIYQPGLPTVWGDTITLGNDTLLLNAAGGVFDLSINDHPFAQNYSIIQHPLHGTVTLNEDGSGSYTPEPGWCGPDHFRYSATDTSGCNAQHIATVSINLSPCASILVEKSDCNDLCSGVANFYQSGVLTEPLSYVWSNGSTNSSAGNLCAGPVSVTVTDALGAEHVYTGNVAASTLQTSISGPQSVCNFSRIELNSQINSTSGTDYHFYWKGQGIYQSLQFEENPNFYCSSTSGTAEYKLFAVSSDGCQDSSSFIIEVMPNPVAKTSVFLPICSMDTLVIKSWIDKPGTPPYKYAWSGPGGAQSNWPDLIWDNPIAGQSGSYYLTVTDANGCTSRTSQYIAIPSNCNYTAVILGNNNPYCAGSDVVLQYGMTPNWKIPDEVQWTGPNNFISNDANPTLTNVQTAMTGWYHVHLRFGDLMISDSALITISPSALDIVSTTIEPVTECFSPYDGKLTLEMSAPPPYQFRFTDEGNYVTYNNNPFIRTNVRQGLRQFEVLKNGCIVRSTIHVSAPDHPVVSVQQESCAGNDASISVSSSHPLNVNWTFPNGNGINNQTAQTNLIPGVYKLYMKDQTTNCVFNDTIILEPYLHFGISVIDTPACDNSNGTLLVLPDNNIPQPVDFVWNTGAVNNPLGNLAPGGYSVTVTDGIGCQRHQNVVLPPKEACIAQITGRIWVNLSCLCLNDTATVRFPLVRVCATSGTHKECSYPANNGSYAIALTEPGSYVLSAESYLPDITPNCPDKLIEITDITRDSAGLDFYFCGQPAADLSIAGYCEPARPGFQHLTVFRVTNEGFWKADTSIVSLKLSPYQTAPLFTPSPLQYDPATQLAVWKVPKLELYEQFNIEIRSVIQATLGDTLSIMGQVLPSTPVDNNLNNNQFLCETLVTGSYDPNDKTVSPLGLGDEGVISRNDTMLVYTIRFQNTGTYTAFTVVLRDTLDASVFNLNSVIPLMSSHPCRIDLERGNVLVYTFDPILLPDSSRSEQGSKGYAVFSIRLKNNLASGVKIRNKAAIYFDYNAPIITNIAQNTVLSTPNVSEPAFNVQLMPNPTADYSTLKLHCNKPLDWVNISLSSVDGREQRPIYHVEHPAEWLSLPVDFRGLESGIYLVWIRSDKGVVVEKVVKM